MPIEAKFANPHKIYVAIIIDFFSAKAFHFSSLQNDKYATNSFNTVFSPSSCPTRNISSLQTPM